MRICVSVIEVCHNVAIEPLLQPLSGELFSHRSANTQPNGRQDIRARGFWSAGQYAFFDIRVFHPNASSNHSTTTAAAYRKHETAKKREYAQRIREVEHCVFTQLVFSTTGGMGREGGSHLLQKACRQDREQRRKNLLNCDGMAPLPSFFCESTICNTFIRGSRSS